MMENKTNQPEKIPAPKVRKITPLDLLKRDVKLYRADCMMSVGNDKKCRPCTAAFFESILGMIDRIALQEAIARQKRKKGKWIGEFKEVTIDENGNTTGSCHCSECGEWLTGSDEYPTRGRYCPNCGSKMEVEDADSN